MSEKENELLLISFDKMTALIPTSQPTGVEAYEDMFKEITRKLYGEETGHGLHTLGTPVAHVATGGPTVPEGERSFTTLVRSFVVFSFLSLCVRFIYVFLIFWFLCSFSISICCIISCCCCSLLFFLA